MSSSDEKATKESLQHVKLEDDVTEPPQPTHRTLRRSLQDRFRQNDATQEEKKLVLKRPWRGFGKACLIHLPPVVVCAVVVWLDRVQAFWFEKDNPTLLNALQFGAKLLELLILSSISAMVLHHARRHMVGVGLPLGLIPAAYRVADIQLLREKSFWNSFLKHKTWRLGVFMACCATFSVLVGPSSAIVLLPSAGYYNFPHAFWNSTGRLLFFSGTSNDRTDSFNMMLPMQITSGSNTLTAVCASAKGSTSSCPEGTSSDATQWFWEKPGFFFDGGDLPDDAYTTVSDSASHLTYESILTYIPDSDAPGEANNTVNINNTPFISVASVPSMNLLRSIQAVWSSARDGTNLGPISNASEIKLRPADNSQVYQPVIQTQCNWVGDSRLTTTITPRILGSGLLSFDAQNQWHFNPGNNWEVPRPTLDNVLAKANSLGSYAGTYLVEWINAEEVGATGQFSIAALIAAPLEGLEQFEHLNPGDSPRSLATCVFTAHWMPSTVEFNPQAQVQVQTNWTDSPNAMASALKRAKARPTSRVNLAAPFGLITIDKDAAEIFNAVMDSSTNETLISSALTRILSPNDVFYPMLNATSTASWKVRQLAAGITTGLNSIMSIGVANLGTLPRLHLLTTTDNTNLAFDSGYMLQGGITDTTIPSDKGAPLPNVYKISIKVDRNGYAYGARNQTVTFAISIIFIYLGVLLLYLAYALWDQLHNHPYPIISWSSIEDIFVLAMNSTPPEELRNCGPGVDNGKTWGHNVKIRTNDEKLEMVFKDSPEMSQVEPKTYYA